VALNLSGGHAAGVERDNLLIDAVKAGLTFLDELRLELTVAADRSHARAALRAAPGRAWAALALNGFRRSAVARVAAVVAGSRVLVVTQVVRQFALQSTLNQGFGQLLEQSFLTQQVI